MPVESHKGFKNVLALFVSFSTGTNHVTTMNQKFSEENNPLQKFRFRNDS
jgi:hypothetical protein